MPVKEERMQILRMLEEGKITAAEAVKLLDSVEAAGDAPRPASRRMIRVRVVDGERDRVNISLPLGLARVAFKLAGRLDKRVGEVDFEQILDEIEQGAEGRIVEIVEKDQRVEVYVD